MSPPLGWKFSPEEVSISIDGETDSCSLNKDIDFVFAGFGVVGQVGNHLIYVYINLTRMPFILFFYIIGSGTTLPTVSLSMYIIYNLKNLEFACQVLAAGSDVGPAGVDIELLSGDQKEVVQKTVTVKDGK